MNARANIRNARVFRFSLLLFFGSTASLAIASNYYLTRTLINPEWYAAWAIIDILYYLILRRTIKYVRGKE